MNCLYLSLKLRHLGNLLPATILVYDMVLRMVRHLSQIAAVGLSLRLMPPAMLALLLGACASAPPVGLEDQLADGPTPRAAQQNPGLVLGQRVRWGGEILSLRNNKTDTEVEIYGRPLLDNAEPKPTGGEGVRFIADIDGFLDPVQYSPGKRLTVSGALQQARQALVGEFSYSYPVVEVQAYHLWPVYQAPAEPLGWRYPYYDPWWPWGPYRHWPYYW